MAFDWQISVGGGMRPSHPDGYAVSFALVGDATMVAHVEGPDSELFYTSIPADVTLDQVL